MSGDSQHLLRVVVHEPDWVPPFMVMCAGYEEKLWRADAFVSEIFSWLPSFVLPWSEQQQGIGSATAIKMLRRAAQVVYDSDKYSRRGEFGELILHGVLRQEFGTEAAVSKFWFKDSKNDTVKGFDVIHVTQEDTEALHLWLGEAKFYKDLNSAARDSLAEIKDHLASDYLRSEFMLVSNKIDPAAPFALQLQALLDENSSLDEVFSVLHIPVLLTFESTALEAHENHCDEYYESLRSEVMAAWQKFSDELGNLDRKEVVIHLILIPLLNKPEFMSLLHERLRVWQEI
jgi:hypothetical protein